MSNVPNNTTFTFQDVTTAVYGDTNAGRNLVSAFADATGTFDPAYVGSKTNLLNFRNYQVVTYTLTIYGRRQPASLDTGFVLKYTVNGGSPVTFGTITASTCTNSGTITGISASTPMTFQCYAVGASGAILAGTAIQFEAQASSNCNTASTVGCPYSVTTVGADSYAFRPLIDINGDWIACI